MIYEAKKAKILQTCYKRAPILESLVEEFEHDSAVIKKMQEKTSTLIEFYSNLPTIDGDNVDQMMSLTTDALNQAEAFKDQILYLEKKQKCSINFLLGGQGFYQHAASLFKEKVQGQIYNH